MEVFTPKEARRVAGITNRQLDYWIKTGLLKPEVETAKGQGSTRLFTFRDLIGLRTIAKLREAGITIQELRKVQENVKGFSDNKKEDVFKDTFLIVRGNNVFMADGENIISTLKEPGSLAIPTMIIDMAGTVHELREEVAKLRKVV